jgi:hypothetical protein
MEPFEFSYDIRKHPGFIPDPDKPGMLKYDFTHYIPDPDRPGKMKYNYDYSGLTEYDKLVREEAQKRIELMIGVLKSRGIDYNPTPIIEKQRKERQERKRQNAKRREEMSKLPEEERERLFKERMTQILGS